VRLIDISRETHALAEAIERHVKALDARHLATALTLGDDALIIATHDPAMASTARPVGLSVIDPA
jgi:predicted nucleic acid-binding protein